MKLFRRSDSTTGSLGGGGGLFQCAFTLMRVAAAALLFSPFTVMAGSLGGPGIGVGAYITRLVVSVALVVATVIGIAVLGLSFKAGRS